ncbi:MAG: FumA C-terminus/TtdB family hydratase beta subunit [Bacteroidota bacterium]
MAKGVTLTMPLKDEAVRDLRVGDTVFLSGTVHTMRDMGHRRAVEMLAQGGRLPFHLERGALWHCGPIVARDASGWRVIAAGSTTSSRFTPLGSELIRKLDIKLTLGKGTMGPAAAAAMREKGACFLTATGGCAVLYGDQIIRVVEVHWADLGLPEAIWVLEVKNLGPFVVGIDSQGASLYDLKREELRRNLGETYGRYGLDARRNYAYLPKRVPAGGACSE